MRRRLRLNNVVKPPHLTFPVPDRDDTNTAIAEEENQDSGNRDENRWIPQKHVQRKERF